MEGSDAQLLASLGYILGSQHGSIWRGLISVSFHLHPTSYTADGFLARKIGDTHKSVSERCKNVAHTKYIFSFSHLRAKADDLFFLLFLPLVRCNFCASSPDSATRKRGCILSPCLFNLYVEYIMRNAGLEETQDGIKITGRNINNLR